MLKPRAGMLRSIASAARQLWVLEKGTQSWKRGRNSLGQPRRGPHVVRSVGSGENVPAMATVGLSPQGLAAGVMYPIRPISCV